MSRVTPISWSFNQFQGAKSVLVCLQSYYISHNKSEWSHDKLYHHFNVSRLVRLLYVCTNKVIEIDMYCISMLNFIITLS